MREAYEILEYTPEALYTAMSSPECGKSTVAGKPHAQYLARYLSDLGAKTIVVEHDYIDGDYLEDYASFYVRCFRLYDRWCKRLHFFSNSFSREEFAACILKGAGTENLSVALQENYHGFVIARPLPSAIIGRTLLATYPSDSGRRNYTALRDYYATLFGLRLHVRSLPYQEQDSVLAACATVALWSAFHKTASLFNSPAPRPAIITRSATRVVEQSRPIPSHGLNLRQMANAVREIGLEPEIFPAVPGLPLISMIYGHLRMGLPVVLTAEVEGMGYHALTINGYSLQRDRCNKKELGSGREGLPLVGLRVNEFYAHDDQIGPFCRLIVHPPPQGGTVQFDGSWTDPQTGRMLKIIPHSVLIPVYNKIRVTFLDALLWLERIHPIVSLLLPNEDLEWNTYLTTVNDYKSSVTSLDIDESLASDILFSPHPRYIWRSELWSNGQHVLDIIADATDMNRSFPIYRVYATSERIGRLLSQTLHHDSLRPTLEASLTWQFLNHLQSSFPPAAAESGEST